MVTDGDSNCVYDGVNYSQSDGVNYGLVIGSLPGPVMKAVMESIKGQSQGQ